MSDCFVAVTADERARESIINDIDKNLFVEAGAGSGKTTMLVNRMVAMIERGIPVNKICAITFTKNAALEFYERFQALLIKRSNYRVEHPGKRFAGDLDKPTELTAKRCLAALADIDLCFMGTIDSFCNMILSEHPTEVGIPSDTSLMEEEEMMDLYRNFYIALLAGQYGTELKEQAVYFNQLYRNSEEAFVVLINELMNRRNVKFAYKQMPLEDVDQKFYAERASILKILAAFDRDLSYLSLKKGDAKEVYRSNAPIIRRRWSGNLNNVESALTKLSPLSYGMTPTALGLEKEPFVRQNGDATVLNINDDESSNALVKQIRDYKYNAVLTFGFACVKVLEAELKKQGKFSLFDNLYYLADTLAKDSLKGGKLIEYIYERHSYFLIDEFQDTNPLQAKIFFHLAAENPTEQSYINCIPRPGSLFIVGDPKQSIYRFRSADVNSYLHIRELFEKNKNSAVLYLVNNFRSRNVMKQYFNTIFSDVMAEASADQSAYQNIENLSSSEQEELDGLYSYTCYGNDPQKEDGFQIAEIIRMLVGNPAYKVNGRLIRFADFMIITAGKEPIGRLSEIFNELRIPLRVEGKVLFENCPALRVINNLYHCIFDGEDVISLVAVLQGPLYGFTDDELAAYKKSRGRIALNVNTEAAEDRIDQALLKIGQLAKELNRCSPSAFLAVIIREFSLFSYVSNERMEILYYVIELLRDGERSGKIISHREALVYIDELLSDESKLERCLSLNDNTDAVHIANLHKVKGLEAPIVILAKAGGTHAPAPNMRIEYEDGEARGYLLALKRKLSKIYDETLIATDVYKDKEVSEKLSLGFERDRLDYVAATRARNVLIINNAYSKTGRKSPNRWSKLFKCLQGDVFEILDNGHRYQGSVRDSVRGQDLLKDGELCFDVTPSYVPMTPSTLKAGSRLKQAEAHSAETFSTLIGTMAHRMMEMIIVSKDSIEKEVMIADILAEYLDDDFADKRLLLAKKLDSLYETIHHGGYRQDSGVERDILPFLLSCDEVYCEVPFTYCLGDELWNGIIDLLYRKDGRLHILDWKTNYDGKDLDDKYQAQLGAYIGAAELLLKEDIVDAHTYHLDLSL